MHSYSEREGNLIWRLLAKLPKRVYAFLLCGLLLFFVIAATSPMSQVYVIADGDQQTVIHTAGKTTHELLDLADKKLEEKDVVQRTSSAFGHDTLTIYRAYSVRIEADGVEKDVILAYGDVADALALGGVTLSGEDFISVDLKAETQPDMEIVVNRVGYEERVVYEDIPYETEYTTTYLLGLGSSRVVSVGMNGKQKLVYRDKIVDGEVVETELVSTKIVSLPKTQVVANGISPRTPHSLIEPPADFKLDASGVPTNYRYVITNAISTAYSAQAGSYTASGMRAFQGTVAVDPKVIPYGTHLYITSADGKYVYGYAIAADTGTALRDGIIDVDLFFNTYEGSCRWGKKKVNIYVLD